MWTRQWRCREASNPNQRVRLTKRTCTARAHLTHAVTRDELEVTSVLQENSSSILVRVDADTFIRDHGARRRRDFELLRDILHACQERCLFRDSNDLIWLIAVRCKGELK